MGEHSPAPALGVVNLCSFVRCIAKPRVPSDPVATRRFTWFVWPVDAPFADVSTSRLRWAGRWSPPCWAICCCMRSSADIAAAASLSPLLCAA